MSIYIPCKWNAGLNVHRKINYFISRQDMFLKNNSHLSGRFDTLVSIEIQSYCSQNLCGFILKRKGISLEIQAYFYLYTRLFFSPAGNIKLVLVLVILCYRNRFWHLLQNVFIKCYSLTVSMLLFI